MKCPDQEQGQKTTQDSLTPQSSLYASTLPIHPSQSQTWHPVLMQLWHPTLATQA